MLVIKSCTFTLSIWNASWDMPNAKCITHQQLLLLMLTKLHQITTTHILKYVVYNLVFWFFKSNTNLFMNNLLTTFSKYKGEWPKWCSILYICLEKCTVLSLWEVSLAVSRKTKIWLICIKLVLPSCFTCYGRKSEK